MHSKPFLAGILAVCLLFLGCVAPGGALPEAKSGEPYTYTIPLPQNPGTPPFKCSAAPGSALPGTLSFSGCTLAGNAPVLSETASQGTFAFSFMVTDANGKSAGPFQATLPVTRGPPSFTPPQLPDATIGMGYNYDFCDAPAAFDCRNSSSVSGGVPPYAFSATGLPLGLFIKSNGELSGSIPEGANEGPVTFQVCATDSAKLQNCGTARLNIRKLAGLTYMLSLKADYAADDPYGFEGKQRMTWEIPQTPVELQCQTQDDCYAQQNVTLMVAGQQAQDGRIGDDGRPCAATGAYNEEIPVTVSVFYAGPESYSVQDGSISPGLKLDIGDFGRGDSGSEGITAFDANSCWTEAYLKNSLMISLGVDYHFFVVGSLREATQSGYSHAFFRDRDGGTVTVPYERMIITTGNQVDGVERGNVQLSVIPADQTG